MSRPPYSAGRKGALDAIASELKGLRTVHLMDFCRRRFAEFAYSSPESMRASVYATLQAKAATEGWWFTRGCVTLEPPTAPEARRIRKAVHGARFSYGHPEDPPPPGTYTTMPGSDAPHGRKQRALEPASEPVERAAPRIRLSDQYAAAMATRLEGHESLNAGDMEIVAGLVRELVELRKACGRSVGRLQEIPSTRSSIGELGG